MRHHPHRWDIAGQLSAAADRDRQNVARERCRTAPNRQTKNAVSRKGNTAYGKSRSKQRSGPPGHNRKRASQDSSQQQRTDAVKMQPAKAAEQPRTAKQKTPCPEKGTQRMEKAGQNSGQARPVSPLRASRSVASFSLLMGGTSRRVNPKRSTTDNRMSTL